MSGSYEHPVRYASRARCNRGEPYAGVDVGVVRLIGAKGLSVAFQGREGTSGSDDGTTFGPAIEVCRRCFAAFGRIRERENNRLAHLACHITYHLLSESTRLARRSNQGGWACVVDYIHKSDAGRRFKLPTADTI